MARIHTKTVIDYAKTLAGMAEGDTVEVALVGQDISSVRSIVCKITKEWPSRFSVHRSDKGALIRRIPESEMAT